MDEWHAYQRAEEELSLTKIQTYLNGLRGKHIGILGYGVSNAPLARMFFEAGAQLTVYDQKIPEQLGESALQLEKDGVDERPSRRGFSAYGPDQHEQPDHQHL